MNDQVSILRKCLKESIEEWKKHCCIADVEKSESGYFYHKNVFNCMAYENVIAKLSCEIARQS